MNAPKPTPLAIVGIGALFPGSLDVTGFWRDIKSGRDLFTEVPSHYWLTEDYYDPDPTVPDKIYAKRGGFLRAIDFDALGFGVPPNLLPMTDTAQLLALHVARQVLEDAAQGPFEGIDRSRTSVVLGIAAGLSLLGDMSGRIQRPVWLKALREHGVPEDEAIEICDRITSNYVEWNESTFPGVLGNVVAGRIANRFDLGGINCTTDAACASSFAALRLAAQELYLGHSDMVITGGADATNNPFLFMCFSKTPALSPTGDCRPFADDADGTMLGEGIGLVALRRLEDAERDGDRIYAVMRGLGASSDGRSKSIYAPRSEGQARALRRAYEAANYSPATVELVEAHGTGTLAGDLAEFGGLRMVFEESGREDQQWCALGSIKSQIGHAKSAAASASLVKTALALHHKVLPPTIKVSKPSERLDIPNSPFYLNTAARPWIRDARATHPRRASVSTFGFGGTNFHATLEEYLPPEGAARPKRLRDLSSELVLLSADSDAALIARCRALFDATLPEGTLPHVARETQQRFDPKAAARLSVVAPDEEGLHKRLAQALARIEKSPEPFSLPTGVTFSNAAPAAPGSLAFLFPGQGSQYVGMGAELAMHFDAARAVWDREMARPVSGEQGPPLHSIVFPPPTFTEEAAEAQRQTLTATEWSQPAIGAASLATLALLRDAGLEADMVAGHSFGDVTALYAGGALDESRFLQVARLRGELMANAAELAGQPGTMTAVRADGEILRPLIERWGIDVTCANFNSPTQTVLSGAVDAIEEAERRLAEETLRFRRLTVATAFHSSLVSASCEPFFEQLQSIAFDAPARAIFADSTASPAPQDAAGLRRMLADAVALPVRFVETIEAMYDAGARTFIEVGPGSVLSRLVGQCLKDRPHTSVATDARDGSGIKALWLALGQLATLGYPVDTAALWAEFSLGVDPRERKPPRLSVSIDGASVGRPYPPRGGAAALPKPNPPRAVATAPQSTPARTPASPRPAVKTPASPRPAVKTPASPRPAVSLTSPRAQSAPAPMPTPSPTPLPSTPQRSVPHPAPTRQQPAAAASAAPPSSDWLAALVEIERQNTAAHQSYQESTAQAHLAFLQASESLMQQLSGSAAVNVTAPVAPRPPVAQRPQPVAPQPIAPQIPQAAQPVAPPVTQAAPAAPPAPQPAAPQPQGSGVDLKALLLDVVAEKTGYPAEILEMEMHMEADLGIDSIKRVEILSGLQERVPSLPAIDTSAMADLQTLADVVGLIDQMAPSAPAVMGGAPSNGVAHAAPANGALDFEALLLDVVAEKTGYPAEILEMEMHMEADLGIDSIKRVEILSGLQERVPGLPAIDTSAMADLQTLGDVIALVGGMGVRRASGLRALCPGQPIAPQSSGVDLKALLLDVVAEKTGYPAEILEMEMHMEADLGIDSIKRVEILSGLQERVPNLPAIDTSAMASLQTLGDVIAYIDSAAPAAVSAAAPVALTPAPASAAASPSADTDFEALLMEVVAEKTGYPAEILEMEMHMEADLGIDSIKRVEILSGLQERVPSLPAIDTSAMANLQTLGDVINFVRAPGSGAASPTRAVGAPAAEADEVLRAAPTLVATPAPGFCTPGLFSGTLHVTRDGRGVAEALVAQLQALGLSAAIADGSPASGVILLEGLRDAQDRAAALEINRAAFEAVRAVAPHFEAGAGQLLVTVQDTGGGFGLDADPGLRAWSAGVSALARTAAREWPGASVKSIDIACGERDAETIARALAEELVFGGPALEVALSADSRRVVQTLPRPLSASAAPTRVDRSSVIIASGGARGVTAATLKALARAASPRFVLLGRTPLTPEPEATRHVETDEAAIKRALMQHAVAQGERPHPKTIGQQTRRLLANREINATIEALRAAGSDARYVAVDIRDAQALDAALSEVRDAWGPITGLIHGAGVLADRRIVDKTPEGFARVFDTKVGGLATLLDATASDPLSLMLLFSSVAARAGNVGQSDYAMANEVLNKVAAAEQRRRGDACLARSLGWGPWDGGMVTPVLREHFKQMGVALISLEGGSAAMVDEIERHDDATEVVLGGQLPSARDLNHADLSSLDLIITAERYPYLLGHMIHGQPVLPMAMVVEFFNRAAQLVSSTTLHDSVTIQDLRSLKGIQLDHFEAGHRFSIKARVASEARGVRHLKLSMEDPDGRKRYQARAEVSTQPTRLAPLTAATSDSAQQSWPWAPRELYDQVLFHRGDFEVVESLDTLSSKTGSGVLKGRDAMHWPADAWQTDPAAVDGALQMALLWFQQAHGRHALPTRMGAVQQHRPLPGQDASAYRCLVHPRDVGQNRAVFDIDLTAPSGDLLVTLRDVEFHALPEPGWRRASE